MMTTTSSDFSYKARADGIALEDAFLQSDLLKLTVGDLTSIYKQVGRELTWAELGVYAAMWSEHCSYKSSKVHLARLPTTSPDVVFGPGENAGVVRLRDDLCVAFKMESHNHPSFIDPYQGAATGVGGILRDIFCMGARPIALANALRFGQRKHSKTSWLVDGVVKGIGDYGNCMGVPTVCGNISYSPSYDGNILVNAMAVGLVRESEIFTGKACGVGNLVIYVGSATGRDGVNGATMASDRFDSQSQEERSAVQVGDPFCEKRLLEATLESLGAGLVVGLQDMGAAGLSSSLVEMADRAGNGLRVNLDRVPVRCPGLNAYELMLSESQERMVMVCEPGDWPALALILQKWDLDHDVIGEVSDTQRFEACFQGELVIDLAIDCLSSMAPKLERPMALAECDRQRNSLEEKTAQELAEFDSFHMAKIVLSEAANPSAIFAQYDYHVQTRTKLGPDSGGAAVLRLDHGGGDDLGIALSTAGCQQYCSISPQAGAALTVAKAARAIFAVGGALVGVTDCLNFGNPEVPEVMASFSLAIDGIALACQKLDVPVISGNVSLYNETDGRHIPATPMIGMVGRVDQVSLVRPAILSFEESELWLLESVRKDCLGWGGTPFCAEGHGNRLPTVDWEAEHQAAKLIAGWLRHKAILSIRDVGSGGVMGTCLKMALASDMGFEVNWQAGSSSLETPASTQQQCLVRQSRSVMDWGERTASYVLQVPFDSSFAAQASLLPVGSSLRLVRLGDARLDGEIIIRDHSLERSVLEECYSDLV